MRKLFTKMVPTMAVVALVLVAALGAADTAQADLLLTLERIADNTIRISGSGNAPAPPSPPDKWEALLLQDVADSNALGSLTEVSGDFKFGINFGGLSSVTDYTVVFQNSDSGDFFYTAAHTPSGASVYTLPGLAFAIIGSSGDLVDRIPGGAVVGRWEMVAPVPLPGAVLLLGAGLGRLVLYRRRQKD